MMKRLTILAITIDCQGHINALIGSTRPLLRRGHRVIFMINETYRGKLAALGFEEYITRPSFRDTASAGQSWAEDLVELGVMGPWPLEEKYRKIIDVFTLGPNALEATKQMDRDAAEAIEQLKPDLLFVDAYVTPSIYWSGIPWVNNVSISALAHCSNDDESLPPSGCGYPSAGPRDEAWVRFKKLNLLYKYSPELNDFYESLGYRRYPEDRLLPYEAALLSLYAYPEEYNYPAMRKKGWFNIEVFNKTIEKRVDLKDLVPVRTLLTTQTLTKAPPFQASFITDTLNDRWSGKWVYLSMGTLGSADITLMKRLMSAISTCPEHKFIISKGPRHTEFTLPPNAWGAGHLPQMSLIPQMDLVITHAGTNTTTEVFAQGVPMILMPLFGDQYDNAQRVAETGYGLRLDPYEFEAEELVEAIDCLLGDTELHKKLKKASERIQAENRHEQLALEIEKRWCKWNESRESSQ